MRKEWFHCFQFLQSSIKKRNDSIDSIPWGSLWGWSDSNYWSPLWRRSDSIDSIPGSSLWRTNYSIDPIHWGPLWRRNVLTDSILWSPLWGRNALIFHKFIGIGLNSSESSSQRLLPNFDIIANLWNVSEIVRNFCNICKMSNWILFSSWTHFPDYCAFPNLQYDLRNSQKYLNFLQQLRDLKFEADASAIPL